jgi:hypothetical protein
MARSELTTANFIDLEASPEIVVEDISWTTLVAGSSNGRYFSFNDAEMLLIYNDTGGAATFTIPLTEGDDLDALNITFNDKTISCDNNDHQFCVVSSKYKDADNYINVDCDVAGKIAVVKKYTIT